MLRVNIIKVFEVLKCPGKVTKLRMANRSQYCAIKICRNAGPRGEEPLTFHRFVFSEIFGSFVYLASIDGKSEIDK